MRRLIHTLFGSLALVSLAGGACTLGQDEDPDLAPDLASVRQAGIWTPQGTPLLGKLLDGMGLEPATHLGADLASARDRNPGVDAVWTQHGQIIAHAQGQDLHGQQIFDILGQLELAASSGSTLFRVLAADQHVLVTGATRWQYDVQVRPEGTSSWQSLCGGGKAFVISGLWQRDGRHRDVPDTMVFACMEGVAAKCIHWGYEPERGADDAWGRHQACTRMARADYCGDGSSHTFDGTGILIYDGPEDRPGVLHTVSAGELQRAPAAGEVELPDGSTSDLWFEAAWRPDGAFCLSKLRWQTLPLGGFCPSILPDPRLPSPPGDPDPAQPSWTFCEDHLPGGDPDELNPLIDHHGVHIFDSSQRNDLGLYRWEHTDGGSFTTTAGLCGGASGDHSAAPAPEFATAHLQGTLLSEVTVSAHPDLAAATLPLVSWVGGPDRFATSTATLAADGYIGDRTEGYLFAPVPGDDPAQPSRIPPAAVAFVGERDDVAIVPLFRHRRVTASGPQHHTTIETAPPASWSSQRVQRFLEGWILQPAGAPGQPCSL